ncbi:hypothetical protein TOPH_03851 [Tolypocladium ophioglossoides CBS 100239]|uniref:Aminoglycoside phosphotransferase domain-containing protein n=1 Tax=Tolypocladium ophioglossoides (strain CBS 100239) TaxID=1163406 RepID=A0A0L0NC74_TOLOC|nr:hypothetical protein TOPH_03851 [Tolypocladium ophioglossoides CBS 100239]
MDPPTTDTTLMNPERAGMLRDIVAGGADRSLSPAAVHDPNLGPRVTGANVVGVGQASQEPTVPTKRSRSEVESDEEDAAPTPTDDTAYLASLLRLRPLRLILEPPATKSSAPLAKTHATHITDAGLVLNDLVRRTSSLPILRLPLLVDMGGKLAAADGGIDRVAHGSLLEDVWPGLKPEQKYEFARQLRKLVQGMRKTPQSQNGARQRQVGSVVSGGHSLLLDKRLGTTYWAVRTHPTPSQFVAFLISTFHSSVPNAVAARIASRFRQLEPPVLSHGELCPRNVIVDKGGIVAIIGWDCAGWYPEWWDYVKFFEARTAMENQDWYEYASEIFDTEHTTELAAYQGVARCQAP